jgi:hypothetical protein
MGKTLLKGAGTLVLALTLGLGSSSSAFAADGGQHKGDRQQSSAQQGSKHDSSTSTKSSPAKGANSDCGNYCSTSDGSPSRNGNGTGAAKGKPCAGCVGKADNKNPKGQAPDGSDHNNGYECDGNHGVGRGNPAHSGCRPASGSDGGSTGGSSGGTGGTTDGSGTDTTGSGSTSGTGSTDGTSGHPGTSSGGTDSTPTATTPDFTPAGEVTGAVTPPAVHGATQHPAVIAVSRTRVLGTKVIRSAPRTMPFTGTNALELALTALGLLTLGMALVRLGRRRTATV